ncbi:MAG: FTR1 family iron permease [Planctomycetota bacterium]|jgi:high-affinity iron transporter|nr:FTR1 family iron permease [Planctomycetota bacterium]
MSYCAKALLAVLLLLAVQPHAVRAGERKYASWGEIAAEMRAILDDSGKVYEAGDVDKAKARVNDAYFGFYEKMGFERTVLSYISGKRASAVEYKFSLVKKLMTEKAPLDQVNEEIALLGRMLREDANKLDGKEESAAGTFVASLLILVREGFEAILVVAAIAAYLVRSGNGRKTGIVYWSAVFAVAASVILAVAVQYLFEISGADQEILEGAAMLSAVVVLFFVSNWMISKAEADAWKQYIDGKVRDAVAGGSAFALGLAAFLAVFREGAETILFYQALVADTDTHKGMIWYGMAAAAVLLVVLFAAIRYGTIVIPMKPFFIGTSILLFIMSISFAGGGVKELQEADVIGVTPVSWVQSFDLLGIYPTVETLLPQAVMLALAAVSIIHAVRKSRRLRSEMRPA